MRASIENLCPVVAALVRRTLAVIAPDREGQPVRAAAAAQRPCLFEDGRHRLAHVPDIDMRVLPIAALPDLALIGGPADAVHQAGTLARALRQFGGDNA